MVFPWVRWGRVEYTGKVGKDKDMKVTKIGLGRYLLRVPLSQPAYPK